MKKQFCKSIKQKDNFGHEIGLNLNNNSRDSKHKTLIGGIFSITLGFWIVILVCYKIKQVWLRENNNLYFHYVEEDETQVYNYNDTRFLSFFVLRNKLSNDSAVWLNETERYLDISFYQ